VSEAPGQTPEDLQVRRELLLRHGIEEHVSTLIEKGAEAVRSLRPKSGSTPMEESQFRNLLNVAMETTSVDVITNFIRYQIGRFPNVWGSKDGEFGPTLIRDIERGDVLQAAEKITNDVRTGLGTDPGGEVFQRAYLRLTRLYLGYAMRTFAYCKKREDAKDEQAWDDLFRPQKGEHSAA
jgi:hypothetical protein